MLTVSKEAREYILSKEGTVYLEQIGSAAMCCGRINLGPSVRLGTPPDAENYSLKIIDGVHVYLPKGFHSPNPLVINVGRTLWFKTLHIDGWKLI